MEYRGYRIPLEEFDAEVVAPKKIKAQFYLDENDLSVAGIIEILTTKGYDLSDCYIMDSEAYGYYFVITEEADEQSITKFLEEKEELKKFFIKYCKNTIDSLLVLESPGHSDTTKTPLASEIHKNLLSRISVYKSRAFI